MKDAAYPITLQQIYPALDEHIPAGARVVTDRLWPRGVKKAVLEAQQISWYNKASPSTELRQALHAQSITAEQFDSAYKQELLDNPQALQPLIALAQAGPLVLLTAMRNPEQTYLNVLLTVLKEKLSATHSSDKQHD